jgi:hypothetical protein
MVTLSRLKVDYVAKKLYTFLGYSGKSVTTFNILLYIKSVTRCGQVVDKDWFEYKN